jgi:hypothetical protein
MVMGERLVAQVTFSPVREAGMELAKLYNHSHPRGSGWIWIEKNFNLTDDTKGFPVSASDVQ